MRCLLSILIFFVLGVVAAEAQSVDYSVVNATEERGIDFMQVTLPNDYVCMPVVSRRGGEISWPIWEFMLAQKAMKCQECSPSSPQLVWLIARRCFLAGLLF